MSVSNVSAYLQSDPGVELYCHECIPRDDAPLERDDAQALRLARPRVAEQGPAGTQKAYYNLSLGLPCITVNLFICLCLHIFIHYNHISICMTSRAPLPLPLPP
jgi:hypothetical protein